MKYIDELIANDRTRIMPGFIEQALEEFAKAVTETDPEQITRDTNGFVSGRLWVGCAKQVLAKLAEMRAEPLGSNDDEEESEP